MSTVSDEQIFAFIEAHIKSVWAIEQMLVLAREPARAWDVDELVRETRSSVMAVKEALRDLEAAALVTQTPDGKYRFDPASDAHRKLAQGVLQTYTERPRSVIRAIFAAPKDNLRIFADAFKFKKE